VTNNAVFIDYFCNLTIVSDFAVFSVGTQTEEQSDSSAKQGVALSQFSHAGLLKRKFRQFHLKILIGGLAKVHFKQPFYRTLCNKLKQSVEYGKWGFREFFSRKVLKITA